MKRSHSRESRKGGGGALNTVVNVAVLLFLGYAVFGSDGPLRKRIREYSTTREARAVVRELLEGLPAEGSAMDGRPPTVVEFTDFQCPFCRDMHDILRGAVADGELGVVVMHLPLERIHPLAKPAAKASLCAEAQGSASVMNHLLMSTRSWMDDSDWGRLARDRRDPGP